MVFLWSPLGLDLGRQLSPWGPDLGLGLDWQPPKTLNELSWLQEASMYVYQENSLRLRIGG